MPRYLSYDGAELSYREAGPADAPALVCLPGGPGADVRYLGTLGGLDAFLRLVLVDQRATGGSPVPDDRAACAFTAQARDLEALRGHLGAERLDLLAHSAGCLTALEYAAAHPDRVRRLILVTPAGRFAREADEDEVAAIKASRADEPWYADARAAEAELAGPDAERLTPEQRGAVLLRTVPFAWGTWNESARALYLQPLTNAPDWYRDAFYAAAPEPDQVPARLARLAASGARPLVVAGGLDGLIGTAPARLVADLLPGSRLEVFEKAGHRLFAEEPERFAALVRDFLQGGD
ncbi:alpha/beta fold hydrolase [Streptacidiphilus monticola]|uniref:Alpha/beta fold hydrolase n=1 Tax=Streptacidiphilus monticola TaxID=2161674 RepID=A0ABW1G966_9ACTN